MHKFYLLMHRNIFAVYSVSQNTKETLDTNGRKAIERSGEFLKTELVTEQHKLKFHQTSVDVFREFYKRILNACIYAVLAAFSRNTKV